jgi:hypothetical protein
MGVGLERPPCRGSILGMGDEFRCQSSTQVTCMGGSVLCSGMWAEQEPHGASSHLAALSDVSE